VWNNIHTTFVHKLFIVRPLNDNYSCAFRARTASGLFMYIFLEVDNNEFNQCLLL